MIEFSNKTKEQHPFFMTTELQRDANKFLVFSLKEPLIQLKNSHEARKLITYPRTDSRYLSNDLEQVTTGWNMLRKCGFEELTQDPFDSKKH